MFSCAKCEKILQRKKQMRQKVDQRIIRVLNDLIPNEKQETVYYVSKIIQLEIERALTKQESSSTGGITDEVLVKRIKTVCRVIRRRVKRKNRQT